MMLWPEDFGWPEDIGAVAVLDPPAGGELDARRVRALVESRLHLVPRLRQVLHRPPAGLGGPYWADDQAFDVRDHVGVAPLRDGAGEAELLAEVERLRRRPFDPSRPRWEMWLLPGLAGRRTGLYLKLHHAVADGLAGIALIGAFLDLEPDPPPTAAAVAPRPAAVRGRPAGRRPPPARGPWRELVAHARPIRSRASGRRRASRRRSGRSAGPVRRGPASTEPIGAGRRLSRCCAWTWRRRGPWPTATTPRSTTSCWP